jgi:hypothetical protein
MLGRLHLGGAVAVHCRRCHRDYVVAAAPCAPCPCARLRRSLVRVRLVRGWPPRGSPSRPWWLFVLFWLCRRVGCFPCLSSAVRRVVGLPLAALAALLLAPRGLVSWDGSWDGPWEGSWDPVVRVCYVLRLRALVLWWRAFVLRSPCPPQCPTLVCRFPSRFLALSFVVPCRADGRSPSVTILSGPSPSRRGSSLCLRG